MVYFRKCDTKIKHFKIGGPKLTFLNFYGLKTYLTHILFILFQVIVNKNIFYEKSRAEG